MPIHLLDVYRSSNIGIFLKANDGHLLVPNGMADTKVLKLSEYLGVRPLRTSIAGSRLIGSLVAMNGSGILVSRLAEDSEITDLRDATGLTVEKLSSRYTAVGNLIAANDRGALVSKIFPRRALDTIRRVLDVTVVSTTVASYVQVGSMVTATNSGAIIHPSASDEETALAGEALGVGVEPATINRGVPMVSSGLVANSQNAVVGSSTTGPELVMLTKALGI